MVTLVFKLSDSGSVQMEVAEPQPLDRVLQKCAAEKDIDLGGFIAIRNGEVITGETIVEDNDIIDIFPAISGG